MLEGWPGNGVCAFSFDPAIDPISAPALWDGALAAAVVALCAAPPDMPPAQHLVSDFPPLCAHDDRGDLHLVIDAGGGRHRLSLWRAAATDRLAILLPPTANPVRIAAANAVRGLLAGVPQPRPTAVVAPSSFQRQRLVLLLAVLDAHLIGESTRAIGTSIVAPRLAGIGAAAWKASSERRRVQRLIGEALALARGGYRSLLSGTG
jgi:hypothetical protein